MGTDVGGTSEIVTKETGILLPENITSKILRQEIVSFIDNKPIKRENVRTFWENNFSASVNYPKFVNFLKEIQIK